MTLASIPARHPDNREIKNRLGRKTNELTRLRHKFGWIVPLLTVRAAFRRVVYRS